VCTLHTYTNIFMPRFGLSGFPGPSRCLIPTPGLTSEYSICAVCVCVCVCIHTRTPTYTPTRVKNREDTVNTPIPPSVINNPPRQAKKNDLIDESVRWCSQKNDLIDESVRWCSQHPFNVHTCTCMVLTTPLEMHAYSPQKTHMHRRACAPI